MVVNEIIFVGMHSIGKGFKSLKQIMFISNQIVHKIAPLNISTSNLSFRDITTSNNHKSSSVISSRVSQWKLKLLKEAIKFRISLI